MHTRTGTQFHRMISLLYLLLFSLIPLSVHSGLRVIDSIETVPQEDQTEIRIRFRVPVNLLSHTPQKKGDLLKIQLRPFSTTDLTPEELQERERRPWKPTDALPLTEVLFDGEEPEGPVLILRFQKTVSYQVALSKDHREILVILSGSGKAASPPPDTRQNTTSLLPDAPSVEPSSSTMPPLKQNTSGVLYAINLLSSTHTVNAASQAHPDLFEKHALYTMEITKEGRIWHRLRLGFFPSRKAAEEKMHQLLENYPSAWVTQVNAAAARKIIEASSGTFLPATTPLPTGIANPPSTPASSEETTAPDGATHKITTEGSPSPGRTPQIEKAASSAAAEPRSLLEEAKTAMTGGNYRRAIQLFTRILADPHPKDRQEAQELLGLARERNGQLAHAKAEYEKYLQLYPKGEGTQRVRQRLYGLLTARATPKEKLRKSKKTTAGKAWRKDTRGSLSQFYWRDKSRSNINGEILNRSLLSTNLDVTTRLRNDRYEVEGLFVGGYDNDFNDDSEDETRVNDLYIDALDKKSKLSSRLGRQSRSTGGVLGRFDGGLINYQTLPQVGFSLVGGYPVDFFTRNNINWDKQFYGLSIDLGTFADRWDFNTFYITQDTHGISDRKAVGGEVRYYDLHRSFFSLVDYDTSYDTMNIFLFVGNWLFPDNTNVNLSLDYRKSPLLTTSNALQGQSAETLDDLLDTYSEEEIRGLAEDRTATSRTFTLGASHPLNSKLQISGDMTLSRLSGTKASGGVEAFEGTGTEGFYSVQLTASSLIKEGDIAVIGLRYADAATSNTVSLNLNTRYPVSRSWRINPRFRVDYRENTDTIGRQLKYRPSIRMDYYWKRRIRLELEAGGEWADDKRTGLDEKEKTRGYFWNIGYRADF